MPRTEQKHESEIAVAVQANGARNHRDSLPRAKVTAGLEIVILELCAPPITQQKLLDLFNNRASFAAIRAWRYGWRAPPLWASELLRAKIRARAAATLAKESMIPRRGPGPGERGIAELQKFRERQSREQINSLEKRESGDS